MKVLANATDLRCEILVFSRGRKWELSSVAFQQDCVFKWRLVKWQFILCRGRETRDVRTDQKMKNLCSRVCPCSPYAPPPQKKKGNHGSLESPQAHEWVARKMDCWTVWATWSKYVRQCILRCCSLLGI